MWQITECSSSQACAWKSNKKHLRISRGRRAALADYQRPHTHGALVWFWQSQVPTGSQAPDCASVVRNWPFPCPLQGLQVLNSSPLMSACVPTTVHTPALNILSQRYIQSPALHSAQTRIPGWRGARLSESLLPPLLAPTQMRRCNLLATKTLTLFYSLIDSLALETILIMFHEIELTTCKIFNG